MKKTFKVSELYTNTFFCVNKIWNDSMNSMGGVPSIELKKDVKPGDTIFKLRNGKGIE